MQKLYKSIGRSIAILLLIVVASVSYGQATSATITGEIQEATGGVLSNVSLALTNLSTGIVSRTLTNDQGVYRISGLDAGVYKVEVSKEGFKSILKNDIELHVQDVAAIGFSMEVGAVSESVTVAAGAPLIDTQSTSLGETIEGRQVQDTPLNGRNAMNLIALVPGVVAEGTTSGSPASNQGSNNTQTLGFGNYQIGGGLAGWNATFVDGANVNADDSTRISLIPTQDSVAEFHVDTNAVTPQFGDFAGGVVNFTTKSGGNRFHGSAYEYLRNTVLDANTFFNGRLGAAVPILHQNQFGATLGGPIVKNKTFFFFSWESTRLLTAAAQSYRVPTPAEMGGDFTADYGSTTDQIKDFANIVNGAPQDPELCPGGGINKICPQHLSPAVQQMFNIHYFQPVEPNPAKLALLQAQGYNSQFVGKQPNNEIQYVGRVDHQLSSKQRLFARYSYWNVFIPDASEDKVPAIPTQPTTFTSQQYVAGDNYTISPTLNADLRVAFNRFHFNQQSNGNGNFDLGQFGPKWAALSPEIPFKAPPTIFPPFTFGNEPFSLNLYTLNNYNNYSLSINLTKVAGRHTMTFGGEARKSEVYNFGYGFGTWASGNFPFVAGGLPQLVTGISNYIGGLSQISVVAPSDAYAFYQGYYLNDSYRATSKLTLNMGLRWELPGAWLEKHDHNSVLLPDAANPVQGFVNPVPGGTAALMGVVAPVNSPDYGSRSQSQIHVLLFEPRLGINYGVSSSTAIRAGFGISHPCLSCGTTAAIPSTSPLNTATTLSPQGFSSIDNPFPNGVLQPLGRSTQLMAPYSAFPQTLIGSSVSGGEPNQTYSYVEQWNLGVLKSFGSSISTMLSYSGSHGLHLGSDQNLNQLPDRYDALGSQLLAQVPNPLYGTATPSGFVGGQTANYGQFLLPFPEFSGFTSSGRHYGSSSYNALSATLRKRFAAGATINASYTWAHFLTNTESIGSSNNITGSPLAQDYTNPRGDWSNAAADIPNTLTVNYILDLPFGKGKYFLSGSTGLVNRLVSGWNLSGITILQSGLPLNFAVANGNSLSNNFNAGTIRPNVVAGVSKNVSGSRYSRINKWFNTAAFVAPGDFSFGNESRVDSTLRADGLKNWDMALVKTTPIREGISIEFRAEYFNVFNHPQYGSPDTQVGDSTFGQINANSASGSTNGPQPRIGQLSLRANF